MKTIAKELSIQKHDENETNGNATEKEKITNNVPKHRKPGPLPARRYECETCNLYFVSLSKLTVHKLRHANQRSYKCSECDASFNFIHCLTRHQRGVHDALIKYFCPKCKRGFSRTESFKRHMKIHIPERAKPFRCEHCERQFVTKLCLSRHQIVHTEERNFQCGTCQKKFKTDLHLRHHLFRVHTNIKPFTCELCDFKTKAMYELRNHARQYHTNERPHECEVCHQRFCRMGELTTHKQRHAAQKLQCEHCDKTFVYKNNLKFHMRKFHDKNKILLPPVVYPCKICGTRKTFMLKHNFITHNCTVHPNTTELLTQFEETNRKSATVLIPKIEDILY